MSQLLKCREKLNLTQEELSSKSGISVRTIQRIESGIKPKGYTLNQLSAALNISNDDLLKEKEPTEKINKQLLKYINLSSILLVFIPFGSIIMPLIMMHWKKEVNHFTKQIVSIQILWTLLFISVIVLVAFLVKLFSFSKEVIPLVMLALVMTNLFVIIRNTIEIEKNSKLHIKLNFNIL
jgi:transcriptional regulator with XRE-family HTH domain